MSVGSLFIFCVSLSEEWIMSSEESDSGVGSNSTTTTTAEQEKLSRNKSNLLKVEDCVRKACTKHKLSWTVRKLLEAC